jgi:hypothetical protein
VYRPNAPEAAPRNELAELSRLVDERDRVMSGWYRSILDRSRAAISEVFVAAPGTEPGTPGEWEPIGHTRDGAAITFSIHDETADAGRAAGGAFLAARCEFREYLPPPTPEPPEVATSFRQVRVSLGEWPDTT